MSLTFWAQIIPGIIVSLVSLFVAWVVKKAVKKIGDTIATREFVTEFVLKALADHEATMTVKLNEALTKANLQSVTNADVEVRLRRIEEAFNVRIRQSFGGESQSQPMHHSSPTGVP
jgi:hypothetical protein